MKQEKGKSYKAALAVGSEGQLLHTEREEVGFWQSAALTQELATALRGIALELEFLVGTLAGPTDISKELSNRDYVLLSPRQWDVLQRFSEGHPVPDIARKLRITPGTVHGHLRSAYRKLGVESHTELAEKLHLDSADGSAGKVKDWRTVASRTPARHRLPERAMRGLQPRHGDRRVGAK